MVKYFKVDGVYHSKVDTETFEMEIVATKMNRLLYKRTTENSEYINYYMSSIEYDRVEINESEYLAAKELFKSQM